MKMYVVYLLKALALMEPISSQRSGEIKATAGKSS